MREPPTLRTPRTTTAEVAKRRMMENLNRPDAVFAVWCWHPNGYDVAWLDAEQMRRLLGLREAMLTAVELPQKMNVA